MVAVEPVTFSLFIIFGKPALVLPMYVPFNLV